MLFKNALEQRLPQPPMFGAGGTEKNIPTDCDFFADVTQTKYFSVQPTSIIILN